MVFKKFWQHRACRQIAQRVLVVGYLVHIGASYSLTIFNPNDTGYDLSFVDPQGVSIASVTVAAHEPKKVTGLSGYDELNVSYKKENTWGQTFFKPFSFLTKWGIGTNLVNNPETATLKPAPFEPAIIGPSFNLIMRDTGPQLRGPWVTKAAVLKRLPDLLAARKAA